MSIASSIKLAIINLISDDPGQYVVGEEKFENELIMSMNEKGESRISAKEAALLVEASRKADEFANRIYTSQINSIVLHASDMVIRAKNGLEKWIKEVRINKKLRSKLDTRNVSQGELPKDHTVKKAEATNGKIKIVPAGELGNQPREKGGRSRDSRVK